MKGKPLEEQHLIGLLKNFDTSLALSYLDRVRVASQLTDERGLSGMSEIQDGVLVDPIGFRISLREPAFIMLSHPICRLRSKVPYPKQIEWERFFVAHLGMVPVYLVNLNVITVLKFWGEDSSIVVSQPFQHELDKGDMLLELSSTSRPAQYSSMNFVLQYGATLKKAPNELLEPFQRYYQFLFWANPNRGYTFSSHFLHRRASITSFMKVTKSLYTVSSVGDERRIYIERQSVDCKELNLVGFAFEGNEVRVVRGIKAYAPVDEIEGLEQRKEIGKCFLNAMMIELRSGNWRANLLSNIVEIGESSFDLTTTLLGLQIDRLYHESDRPSYTCTVDELRNGTTKLLRDLFAHIQLPITLSDSIDHFQLALRSLHPFVVVDGDRVLFAHPIIAGFLAQQGMLHLLSHDHRAIMADLLNLIEKVHDSTRGTLQIFIDPRMDRFKGGNKKESMEELFSINRRIGLYKSLRQSFGALESSKLG